MNKNQSSYRQILKATSIFGGVQVFHIIIQIIRSKFIAVLLGPFGMGIAGLLNTTINLIAGLTSFGLGTSAVKNVSEANASENKTRVAVVIKVLRRWVWITGTLGTIITLLLSSWLSLLTFGNKDYTVAFIWISITLLFKQLTSGQLVVLQGLRKLKFLAKANLAGSSLGLVIIIPLYYYFGIDGIVPAIIISAIISLLLSWYYSNKIKIEPIKISKLRLIAEGKNMLIMGFMISLSGLIATGISYIVRIFISNQGGIDEVGLYTAGFAIINTYVGLVFTAMGTDYYPRLSAVAHSNLECKKTINQQAEIAILILAPIILVFLVFIKWIIIVLYSNKFIAVDEMIHWAALGMLFKAAGWAIGFILLAKGSSRLFFLNDIISNSYLLFLNLLGYYLGGLTGLGISFMIGSFLHLIQMYFFSRIKYDFNFDIQFIKIFVIQFSLALSSFIIIKVTKPPYSYIVGVLLIAISSYYSYVELDKRIGILKLYYQWKNKHK